MGSDIESLVAAMPKVELHIHLVGSVTAETTVELMRRHGEGPREQPDDAEPFRSFSAFATAYGTVGRLIRDGSDVEMVVERMAAQLAAAGVAYAEATVTPLSHIAAGVAPDELGEALEVAGRRAAANHGVRLAWIFDISGELGPSAGRDTLRWVLHHAPSATVGLGLGGPEVDVPRVAFKQVFDEAIATGLHSVPHAGETDGPESVWSALRDLRAERIGHGIQSVRDPGLLDYLAREMITLEVCPTSNVSTGIVAEFAEHPLPALVDAGVPVTLATDDPGLFATDLTGEYLRCHEQLGLSVADLLRIAETGIDALFGSARLRSDLREDLRAFAARTRALTEGVSSR